MPQSGSAFSPPSFDWKRLADKQAIQEIARAAVDSWVITPFHVRRAFVPYQYTLEVMCRVYHLLQQGVLRDQGVGSVQDPRHIDEALRCPLRALAYFSWEAERQEFLIRRVYPRYFDFISYSSVPLPWGALGVMYDELGQDPYRGYSVVDDVYQMQRLLPYLRETHRLQYRSVVAVPVHRGDQIGRAQLSGALVFYGSGITPPNDKVFSGQVQSLSRALSHGALAHEGCLQSLALGPKEVPPPSITGIWRSLVEEESRDLDVYELVVDFPAEIEADLLEGRAAQLRSELAALDLFCFREGTQSTTSVRFLIAPSGRVSEHTDRRSAAMVSRHINASVGIACAGSNVRAWNCQKLSQGG